MLHISLSLAGGCCRLVQEPFLFLSKSWTNAIPKHFKSPDLPLLPMVLDRLASDDPCPPVEGRIKVNISIG